MRRASGSSKHRKSSKSVISHKPLQILDLRGNPVTRKFYPDVIQVQRSQEELLEFNGVDGQNDTLNESLNRKKGGNNGNNKSRLELLANVLKALQERPTSSKSLNFDMNSLNKYRAYGYDYEEEEEDDYEEGKGGLEAEPRPIRHSVPAVQQKLSMQQSQDFSAGQGTGTGIGIGIGIEHETEEDEDEKCRNRRRRRYYQFSSTRAQR